MVKVSYKGKDFWIPEGTNLRTALLAAEESPHNGKSRWINCKGSGTCGTCAVAIQGRVTPVSPRGVEQWRLNFPPHDSRSGLRLACQVRVVGDIEVLKRPGFWGSGRS